MKKMIAITAVALLAWAAAESQAEAGIRFGIGIGHYGGYHGHHGHHHSYPRAYRWHDTSHYDYHPGGFVRHYNHYHYVPGHYHFHRDGHWDHWSHRHGHWHHGH